MQLRHKCEGRASGEVCSDPAPGHGVGYGGEVVAGKFGGVETHRHRGLLSESVGQLR